MLMFALKGKYKILNNKVRSLPVVYYAAWTVAMLIVLLYEPMVNFSAKFNCVASNKIATFC